jgi:hypothetical protein
MVISLSLLLFSFTEFNIYILLPVYIFPFFMVTKENKYLPILDLNNICLAVGEQGLLISFVSFYLIELTNWIMVSFLTFCEKVT